MTNQMLVFGGDHNGINCIQNNAAERPCDKIWFTAKQIEEWSGMSKTTLWRKLKILEEKSRISSVSCIKHVNIPTETGAVKTTIYNLNVLNQLAMVCIELDVLNETAKKFSDILSEVETTGSYGAAQKEIPDERYGSVKAYPVEAFNAVYPELEV